MSHNWVELESNTHPVNNDKVEENNKVINKENNKVEENNKVINKVINKENKIENTTKKSKNSLRYCHYVESDEDE